MGYSFLRENQNSSRLRGKRVPFYARPAVESTSAREMGIFFSARTKILAACAGNGCHSRPGCQGIHICAGMGYSFRRGNQNSSRLRGKRVPFPPGLPGNPHLRGKWVSFSAREKRNTSANAGMGYLFQRTAEKCNRLCNEREK